MDPIHAHLERRIVPLLTLATSVGIDPLHFAVFAVLNLMSGLTMPPIGVCLFGCANIARLPLGPVIRAILPFILANILALLLVSYVPPLATLPRRLLQQDGWAVGLLPGGAADYPTADAFLVRVFAPIAQPLPCRPNARPELMRDAEGRQALKSIVARSFCPMPSTSDLGFLFPGLSEDAAIEKLLAASTEVVAVKRGSKGTTLLGYGERHDLLGHAVDEVDPTGAGDCFCGAPVALLAQGRSSAEVGRAANAAGAIAVTRRGPMEGNSGPREIADFLAARASMEGAGT